MMPPICVESCYLQAASFCCSVAESSAVPSDSLAKIRSQPERSAGTPAPEIDLAGIGGVADDAATFDFGAGATGRPCADSVAWAGVVSAFAPLTVEAGCSVRAGIGGGLPLLLTSASF